MLDGPPADLYVRKADGTFRRGVRLSPKDTLTSCRLALALVPYYREMRRGLDDRVTFMHCLSNENPRYRKSGLFKYSYLGLQEKGLALINDRNLSLGVTDIESFYPNLSREQIVGALRTHKVPSSLVDQINEFLADVGFLPQGFELSDLLAAFVLSPLLRKLTETYGFSILSLNDDLFIFDSSRIEVARRLSEATEFLGENGLRLGHKKSRVVSDDEAVYTVMYGCHHPIAVTRYVDCDMSARPLSDVISYGPGKTSSRISVPFVNWASLVDEEFLRGEIRAEGLLRAAIRGMSKPELRERIEAIQSRYAHQHLELLDKCEPEQSVQVANSVLRDWNDGVCAEGDISQHTARLCMKDQVDHARKNLYDGTEESASVHIRIGRNHLFKLIGGRAGSLLSSLDNLSLVEPIEVSSKLWALRAIKLRSKEIWKEAVARLSSGSEIGRGFCRLESSF